MRVVRKEFDGITQAFGVYIGNALEFEVPDHIAHFFKELGYEVIPVVYEFEEKLRKKERRKREGR